MYSCPHVDNKQRQSIFRCIHIITEAPTSRVLAAVRRELCRHFKDELPTKEMMFIFVNFSSERVGGFFKGCSVRRTVGYE